MSRELNRQLVRARKADLTGSSLASGGLLAPEQDAVFFRKLIDQPTVLQEARIVFINSPTREINKVGFGSRILKNAATDATASGAGSLPTALASGNRSAVTLSKVTLATKEVIGEVDLPQDVIEDNIERGRFSNTTVEMIAERVALDLEDLVISGDTTGTLNDGTNYMKTLDGIRKLSTSNTTNANGVALSGPVFKAALRALPSRYKKRKRMMRFYASDNNELNYREALAARMTGLGDAMTTGDAPVAAYGVPLGVASEMPETELFLTDPKNIIVAFQRRVTIQTDYSVRERLWIVVVTMRLDVKLEEEDATVRVTNIG